MRSLFSVHVPSFGSRLFTSGRERFRLSPAIFLLALSAGISFAQPPSVVNRTKVNANYGKLPLSFEANQGQTNPSVRFASRGEGYSLFLTDSAAELTLSKEDPHAATYAADKHSKLNLKADVIRMELAGELPGVKPVGADPLAGKVNYFIGNDASRWHSNIPTYSKVKYSGVYPGIDLVYYGNQRQLEYDFTVAPGADPRAVRLHLRGAAKLALEENGELTVSAPNGEISFLKPVVYQIREGKPEPVEGQFALLGNNDLGFNLGKYDHTRVLVIDPVLAYSSYLGGSGGDSANGIALDSSGDVYIAGTTYSPDFLITSGVYQDSAKSDGVNPTAFVTELNPQSTGAIYSTYFGGSGGDGATAIAVDAFGRAYITGDTCSSDFPVSVLAYQTVNQGLGDNSCVAFVTKLNAGGSEFFYSTYLGGSGAQSGGGTGDILFPGVTFPGEQDYPGGGDKGTGIAIDSAGYAYVIGIADSTDFPVTPQAFRLTKNPYGGPTVFVTKVNTGGTGLVYSTYLGGSTYDNADYAGAIAVDSAGDAYLAGSTASPDFPTTGGAFQTAPPGGYAAFVTKMNPAGSGLIYSTYLGGEYADFGNGIAIDSAGNAYVTGSTSSLHFPVTPGAFQTVNKGPTTEFSGGSNAFVSKLNPTGTNLIYSTFLGGSDNNPSGCLNDTGIAIALDGAGQAYVTGAACSLDFPVTADAYQSTNPNTVNSAAFYTRLNAAGSALLYSTFLGGSGNPNAANAGVDTRYWADIGDAIAVDSSGNAYLAGYTGSANFPLAGAALQTTNKAYSSGGVYSGWDNGFVAQFVAQSPSTAAVVSSVNPEVVGAIVSFTATVAPVKGVVVPTGNVYFYVDGTYEDLVALDGTGKATYSTNELTVGQHQILAIYPGDGNYTSTEATFSEAIDATSPTTTTLKSSPNPSILGNPVTFTAVVAAQFGSVPTGTVHFDHDGTVIGSAALSGGTASVSYSGLAVGSGHPITARYLGSATDAASASKAIGQTVQYATTTTLKGSPNPAVYQSAVVFTAHVHASGGATPTGTVAFFHDRTVIGSATLTGGVASVSYSGLGLGSGHPIVAKYLGSASDAPSTSPAFGESVELVTTTSLKSSLNPSTSGTSVTFTATVTVDAGEPEPTGTVTFRNGTASIGAATLSGGTASLATSSLPVGSLPITAVYVGSADDMPSTSSAITQKVKQ